MPGSMTTGCRDAKALLKTDSVSAGNIGADPPETGAGAAGGYVRSDIAMRGMGAVCGRHSLYDAFFNRMTITYAAGFFHGRSTAVECKEARIVGAPHATGPPWPE